MWQNTLRQQSKDAADARANKTPLARPKRSPSSSALLKASVLAQSKDKASHASGSEREQKLAAAVAWAKRRHKKIKRRRSKPTTKRKKKTDRQRKADMDIKYYSMQAPLNASVRLFADPRRSQRSPAKKGSAAPSYNWLHRGAIVRVDRGKFKGEHGTIHYCGPVRFAPGTWVGLSLQVPAGLHDGEVANVRYFQCRPLHGVFVRPLVLSPVKTKRLKASRSMPAMPSSTLDDSEYTEDAATAALLSPLSSASTETSSGSLATLAEAAASNSDPSITLPSSSRGAIQVASAVARSKTISNLASMDPTRTASRFKHIRAERERRRRLTTVPSAGGGFSLSTIKSAVKRKPKFGNAWLASDKDSSASSSHAGSRKGSTSGRTRKARKPKGKKSGRGGNWVSAPRSRGGSGARSVSPNQGRARSPSSPVDDDNHHPASSGTRRQRGSHSRDSSSSSYSQVGVDDVEDSVHDDSVNEPDEKHQHDADGNRVVIDRRKLEFWMRARMLRKQRRNMSLSAPAMPKKQRDKLLRVGISSKVLEPDSASSSCSSSSALSDHSDGGDDVDELALPDYGADAGLESGGKAASSTDASIDDVEHLDLESTQPLVHRKSNSNDFLAPVAAAAGAVSLSSTNSSLGLPPAAIGGDDTGGVLHLDKLGAHHNLLRSQRLHGQLGPHVSHSASSASVLTGDHSLSSPGSVARQLVSSNSDDPPGSSIKVTVNVSSSAQPEEEDDDNELDQPGLVAPAPKENPLFKGLLNEPSTGGTTVSSSAHSRASSCDALESKSSAVIPSPSSSLSHLSLTVDVDDATPRSPKDVMSDAAGVSALEVLQKRQLLHERACQKFIESEVQYMRCLRVLIEYVLRPMEDPAIVSKLQMDSLDEGDDLHKLFSSYATIANFHELMLHDFNKKGNTIGEVFGRNLSFLQGIYATYFQYYKVFLSMFKQFFQLRVFHDLINVKRRELAKKGIHLDVLNLLKMPIRRIPRLEQLLKELLENTDQDLPQYVDLENALSLFQRVKAHLFLLLQRITNEIRVKLSHQPAPGPVPAAAPGNDAPGPVPAAAPVHDLPSPPAAVASPSPSSPQSASSPPAS